MVKKLTPNRKYTPEFKDDVLRLVTDVSIPMMVQRHFEGTVILFWVSGHRLILACARGLHALWPPTYARVPHYWSDRYRIGGHLSPMPLSLHSRS